MGAELIRREAGYAYRFGDRQLNVHGPGVTPAEVARLPVEPGNSDLCFEWRGPIADAVAHLKSQGVAIERGPLQRFGAKGAGVSVYFRDPDGSLMEFISYARDEKLQPAVLGESGFDQDRAHPIGAGSGPREAPGAHDPTFLPPGIPVPQDDGAARHLPGMRLPDLALPATRRGAFNLALLHGRTVLYIYPRTGVPGVDLPPGWDDIPGARGCTPQSCGFRDHFAELKALGVDHVFGLSTQDTDYQREAAERLHLAVSAPLRRGTRIHPRARPADLCGRGHDPVEAHGARHRRRRHRQGVLSGVPAGPERRRSGSLVAQRRSVARPAFDGMSHDVDNPDRSNMPDRSDMARRSWSLQDAKNRFSEVVEAARRQPQTVTKHGKPTVVVVDVAEYERLRQLERVKAPTFTELLLAMPQDDGKFPRSKVRPHDLDV